MGAFESFDKIYLKMSIFVNSSDLNKNFIKLIVDELSVKQAKKYGFLQYEKIEWPLKKYNNCYNLPLGFVTKHNINRPLIKFENQSYDHLNLRSEQQCYLKSVLKFEKSFNPFSQAWSLIPGFGKTIMALAAIVHYNMEANIIVHVKDLKTQWETEILKHNITNCKVFMIGQLKDVKAPLIIVDEAHACMTKTSTPILCTLQPSILIGLSGTFYRQDKFDYFLKWIYGTPIFPTEECTSIRDTSLVRKINVTVIKTSVSPECKQNSQGRLDWNSVLVSLASNELRNMLICDLIKNNPTKNILVLVNFKNHGEYFEKFCKSNNISCVCYFSTGRLENIKDVHVVISTFKKIGTGISINWLNTLIFAAPVMAYALQYISRVLREKSQDASIFDLVDNNFSLQKHFKSRLCVYKNLSSKIEFK